MACVTNMCNECDHHWTGLIEDCPKCESKDTYQEFDEWQDHDKFEYEKNPER